MKPQAARRGALALLAALALVGSAAAQQPAPKEDQGEGVTLTVYNQNFVVVREQRLMDLKKGRASVRFRDVAATIVPETVQFSLPGKPDAARVVEQSYEFDLVSAARLLEKYIDREITVVTRDGSEIKGKLLSFDDSQLVLQSGGNVDLVPRGDNVKDLQLSALPEGLLTRPTLVWLLDARAAGKEVVKVSYAAGRMAWRADYRARVNEAGDRMDLAGWVTITNSTGTSFKEARIRLMAGDLNLVSEIAFSRDGANLAAGGLGAVAGLPAQITQKSFADYHLYELGRKATLKDHATKQIELLDVKGIPLTRKYVVRPGENRVGVLLEFKNDRKLTTGLGVPLPKGPVRVFQRATDGALELAGTDSIDHTPKDEKVSLRLSYAFDLTARRKILAERVEEKHREYDVEIRLRNHKKEAVTIEVIESLPRPGSTVVQESHPSTRRDASTLVYSLTVQPNFETVLTCTVRYPQITTRP
ncbi:MAG: hypothetical protein L0Z62_19140 [Gemmataceae bacterium]|nr:hypothetical protein [Gemmataceae bacterium]